MGRFARIDVGSGGSNSFFVTPYFNCSLSVGIEKPNFRPPKPYEHGRHRPCTYRHTLGTPCCTTISYEHVCATRPRRITTFASRTRTHVYTYICACAHGYGYGRRDRGSRPADRISATTVGSNEIGFICIYRGNVNGIAGCFGG